MRSLRAGFTLLELLVVVAVIALLAAILVPVLNKSRETSRLVVCMSNQREVFAGVIAFSADHNNYCPGANGALNGGPGTAAHHGIGQLTSVDDSLDQTVLERTSRSALLMGNYLPSSSVFHCPQADKARDSQRILLDWYAGGLQANFQYTFNQWFVSTSYNPTTLLPTGTFKSLIQAKNPRGCVLITEEAWTTDSEPEGPTNRIHAAPVHNYRPHLSIDANAYTAGTSAVCTFLDGHTEMQTVDTSGGATQYTVPTDNTGLR